MEKTVAFSYLNEDNLIELYNESKEYTSKLTVRFEENARIARNIAHPNTPARFPKTTDGTTASIIAKTPKRVIQQLPTGVITTDQQNDPRAIIADFVYRERILPHANLEYDLIQKCWNTIEDGQTFGSKSIYTAMTMKDGELLPDYIPLYWGDVMLQIGKKSGYDSKYVFMRTWWQESDVDSVIDEERQRAKEAREQGVKYSTPWKIDALENLKHAITAKDDLATAPSDKELNINESGIEIVTAMQVGKNSKWFTFNPDTEEIIRVKKNKDPRGLIPIDWYYYDIDGANPLGRSLIDLVGPLQNLIDSDMQAYQYNRALALQPPLQVKGPVNDKQILFAPAAINKIPENGSIEAMSIDTTAIRDYPNIYGMQKSQLLNLVASPDTSISADVGNPGFGKTPAAIKTQNAQISVDDNAIRKSFEAFFENWSETAINMYFAEQSGQKKMVVDDETALKLQEIGYPVDEDNTTIVDFDHVTTLRFRVDASTTKVNSEADQLEALQLLLQTLDSSASLAQIVPVEKKIAAWNAIVANSGVEDTESLTISQEEMESIEQGMQAQAQAMPGEEETAEAQMELPPEEQMANSEVIEPVEEDQTTAMLVALRDMGIDEDLIEEVPAMIDKGYTDNEIVESVEGVMDLRRQEDGR